MMSDTKTHRIFQLGVVISAETMECWLQGVFTMIKLESNSINVSRDFSTGAV